jgi:ABC-type nitrate/sulfonate/bicarbonate transport system substrate-binding protein
MLEGAVPRELITTVAAVTHPGERLAAMRRGDFDATVLQEPWITVAEKAGCRLVSTTFFHGTWVAGPDVAPILYAAFLRGVTQAVHRINADKRKYLPYFKEGWAAGDPLVQALTLDDFNLGRIQLRPPTPIPEGEARWAWDWMASWGVLEGAFDVTAQINRKVQQEAHELAASSR